MGEQNKVSTYAVFRHQNGVFEVVKYGVDWAGFSFGLFFYIAACTFFLYGAGHVNDGACLLGLYIPYKGAISGERGLKTLPRKGYTLVGKFEAQSASQAIADCKAFIEEAERRRNAEEVSQLNIGLPKIKIGAGFGMVIEHVIKHVISNIRL